MCIINASSSEWDSRMDMLYKILPTPRQIKELIFTIIFIYILFWWALYDTTITIPIDLPQPKGVVTIWEPIEPGGELGEAPHWYVDYESMQKHDVTIPNSHINSRIYTPEEHVCLAQNIYFEARNESLKGQLGVALVTLTRVTDPRYPNDICSVVYENKQFSWYSDGQSDTPKNKRVYDEISLVASAILNTDTALHDFTHGSTHYHANYVDPYWAEYMIYITTVDTHLFYKEHNKNITSL